MILSLNETGNRLENVSETKVTCAELPVSASRPRDECSQTHDPRPILSLPLCLFLSLNSIVFPNFWGTMYPVKNTPCTYEPLLTQVTECLALYYRYCLFNFSFVLLGGTVRQYQTGCTSESFYCFVSEVNAVCFLILLASIQSHLPSSACSISPLIA